jgi:hypothetical protein
VYSIKSGSDASAPLTGAAPPSGAGGAGTDPSTLDNDQSTSSWHPFIRIEVGKYIPANKRAQVDSVYLLIIKLQIVDGNTSEQHNLTVDVQWRDAHGYLSAVDRPLLMFYGCVCARG